MTNLTIYHLRISQSERAIWVAEELGLDYKLECFDRDPTTKLAPEAYKKLSPTHTAPVITDVTPSGQKIVLAESGAVVEYINAVYGDSKLSLTKEDPDFANYLFWLHFAGASLMSTYMSLMGLQFVDAMDLPPAALFKSRLTTYLQLLDEQAKKTTWLAGEKFTLADILMVFPLTTMSSFLPTDLKPYPSLQAYLKRIMNRPAYQRAMQKGDPEMKINL